MPRFVPLDVGYRPRVASARVWNRATPENLKVLLPVSEPPFRSPGLVLTRITRVGEKSWPWGRKIPFASQPPDFVLVVGLWPNSSLYLLMGIEVVKMVSCRSRNLPFAS